MKTKIIFYSLSLLSWNAFAQQDHSSGHSNAPAHNKKETAHSHRAAPSEKRKWRMENLANSFIRTQAMKLMFMVSGARNARTD